MRINVKRISVDLECHSAGDIFVGTIPTLHVLFALPGGQVATDEADGCAVPPKSDPHGPFVALEKIK